LAEVVIERLPARQNVPEFGPAFLQSARDEHLQLRIIDNLLRPPTLGDPKRGEPVKLRGLVLCQRILRFVSAGGKGLGDAVLHGHFAITARMGILPWVAGFEVPPNAAGAHAVAGSLVAQLAFHAAHAGFNHFVVELPCVRPRGTWHQQCGTHSLLLLLQLSDRVLHQRLWHTHSSRTSSFTRLKAIA
jgi:hypothetical protein